MTANIAIADSLKALDFNRPNREEPPYCNRQMRPHSTQIRLEKHKEEDDYEKRANQRQIEVEMAGLNDSQSCCERDDELF